MPFDGDAEGFSKNLDTSKRTLIDLLDAISFSKYVSMAMIVRLQTSPSMTAASSSRVHYQADGVDSAASLPRV